MTTQSNHPTGPLAGVRVLDLSRILSGPFCSMMLADWGAEVVKVEMPQGGDGTRGWGPPFVEGESAYFLSVNRNKRSVAIDLKAEEGREIVRRLAAESDVLLENFRPGTTERLGAGYEELSRINPRLVYCSISGFGQDGPYRDRPGFDAVAQAMSGMMSITGEPEGAPTKHGMSIADLTAGMWAAFAISSALYERERSGRGQHLDVSLLDGQISWLTYVAGAYFATGNLPTRYGSGHPTIVPYQPFATQDGYIMLAVGTDKQWQVFCRAADLEHVADDPRFATNAARVENRDAVIDLVAKVLKRRTTQSWQTELESVGVPCGPINNVAQVFDDPHVRAREMVTSFVHPRAGTVQTVGVPVKLSRTPGTRPAAPPLLGEHTRAVLLELGYTDVEVDALAARRVIDLGGDAAGEEDVDESDGAQQGRTA